MPYTEADFERMEGNKEFTRKYCWTCATKAKIRAAKTFANKNATSDDIRLAKIDEAFSNLVLGNLDDMVNYVAGIPKGE